MKKNLGSCVCCGKDIYNLGDDWPREYLDKANTVELDLTGHPVVHGVYGSTTLDMSTARIIDAELFNNVCSSLRKHRNTVLYVCDDCIRNNLGTKFVEYGENFFHPTLCLSNRNGIKLAIRPNVEERHLYQSVPRDVFAFSYDDDGPDFIAAEMQKFGPFVHERNSSGIEYDQETKEIHFYFREDRFNESIVHSFTLREHQYLVVYSFHEYEVLDKEVFFRRFMRTFSEKFS